MLGHASILPVELFFGEICHPHPDIEGYPGLNILCLEALPIREFRAILPCLLLLLDVEESLGKDVIVEG